MNNEPTEFNKNANYLLNLINDKESIFYKNICLYKNQYNNSNWFSLYSEEQKINVEKEFNKWLYRYYAHNDIDNIPIMGKEGIIFNYYNMLFTKINQITYLCDGIDCYFKNKGV